MHFRITETRLRNGFIGKMILWALFLTGVLLRIVALWQKPVMSRDAISYIRYAEGVFPPGETVPPFPPMLILLLRFFHAAGFSWEMSGWLINLAAGSLLILVVHGVVFQLWNDRKWALLAALFTAVHPSLIKLSIVVQRDSLYLLFFWGCIYFLLRLLTEGDWRFAAVAGALTGCAVMTRFEALELFLLCGTAVFFIWKRYGAKRTFFLTSAMLLPCLVVLAAGLCMPRPWDLCSTYTKRFLFLQKRGL